MVYRVRVKPSSKINAVKQQEDGVYCVSLTASPHDGKANKQLIKLLADFFNVAQSDISIKSGLKSRDKLVIIS